MLSSHELGCDNKASLDREDCDNQARPRLSLHATTAAVLDTLRKHQGISNEEIAQLVSRSTRTVERARQQLRAAGLQPLLRIDVTDVAGMSGVDSGRLPPSASADGQPSPAPTEHTHARTSTSERETRQSGSERTSPRDDEVAALRSENETLRARANRGFNQFPTRCEECDRELGVGMGRTLWPRRAYRCVDRDECLAYYLRTRQQRNEYPLPRLALVQTEEQTL
jgi:hypothetical protein